MLENVFGAFTVGFFIRGEDGRVTHVNDKPFFGDHVVEGITHEMLECGRGVGEAKEHDSRFEEAFVGDEGGLSLRTIFDLDIVIAILDVTLGE